MKFFVFATVIISSLILAPSTDAGICARISSRREARVERRVNRYELQLGDRMEYYVYPEEEYGKTYSSRRLIRRNFRIRGNSGC